MAVTKRRIRMLNAEQKKDFIRLASQLRTKGATDEELMDAIGAKSVGQLNAILGSGQTTIDKLERLHKFADEILPELLRRSAEKREQEISARAVRLVGAIEAAPAPEPKVDEEVISDDPMDHPARGSISPRQHKQLKDWIEHLVQVYGAYYGTLDDPTWGKLAPVLGLKNGKSAKRAYDVGCSPRTYFFLKRSVNLHAAYGSTAAESFVRGIPIESLLKKQTNGSTPAAAGAPPAASPTPALVPEDDGSDVPVFKGSALLEFLEAVNIHVQRLHKTKEFFELMESAPVVPAQLQKSAKTSREFVEYAIEEMVPGYLARGEKKLPG